MTYDELVEFVGALPASLHDLVKDWPPTCVVRARPGVVLLVPGPGVEGIVVSYFEPYDDLPNGGLGVLGPVTIPHPEHGYGTATPGEPAKAECRPECLEVVRSRWTRADVDAALAGRPS